MRHDAHRDENDEQVDEDGRVGQPAVVAQRAHLADAEAHQYENDAADGVAEAEFGHLADALPVLDDDLAEDEEEEEGLQHVDQVPRGRAEDAKGQVAVVAHGELVRVQAQEGHPEQVAAVAGHEAEDRVQRHAGAPAQGAEGEADAVGLFGVSFVSIGG